MIHYIITMYQKSTKILKSYLIRGVLKLKQKQTEEADTVTNTEPYLKDC